VNKDAVLHPYYPLRPPLWRFEGLAKVRPMPICLAVLKLNYLAGIFPLGAYSLPRLRIDAPSR
jgi:hypothetical protein